MTKLHATAILFSSLALIACKPDPSTDEEAGDTDTTATDSNTDSGSESGDGDGDATTTATDDEPTTTAETTADTADTTDTTETGENPGDLIGQFVLTYYWFLYEADYQGADTTILRDSACSPIANVPDSFAADVCVEGAGKLTGGEVINVDGNCDCGYNCNGNGIVCFTLLDEVQFPWGAGSSDNPLEPLRSWAVDEAVIPHGTVVYAPDWDGMEIPAIDGIGGFTHDGCFRADDVGGGIDGYHIDFFAGTTMMWESLEAVFPSLDQEFAVYQNSPACEGFGG